MIQFLFPMEAVRWLALLGVACVLTFVGLDLAIDGGAFLKHFHQSWMSHFAPAISTEYGSPDEHRFPFALLVKNWDLTIPAGIGVVALLKHMLINRRERKERRENWMPALVPVIWLIFALALFTTHKPWWAYYYVHIAIPLCLCGGFGLACILARARMLRKTVKTVGDPRERSGTQLKLGVNERAPTFIGRRWRSAMAGLFVGGLVFWIGSRAYLEISEIRKSPQTYYAIVLNEIERFKPFTDWIYADNLTYSFYSGIPIPPQLAVIPLKRLWSGEMTNAVIRQEVEKFRPGLIALRNDTRETPFQELLNGEYRLVFQDAENRLYAHASIANKPDLAATK